MAELMTVGDKEGWMAATPRYSPTQYGRVTFEDLRGLRSEGYIRDSTLDQRDGYGPELQRRAIHNFAKSYGLGLGDAWYTDFITGTSTLKRSGFHQALDDAGTDRYDVLLVYNTSRFARNRADAIRYKAHCKNWRRWSCSYLRASTPATTTIS